MNIYVGNLAYSVTEDELLALFTEFGDVASAKLIMDKYTGQSKGLPLELEQEQRGQEVGLAQ